MFIKVFSVKSTFKSIQLAIKLYPPTSSYPNEYANLSSQN